MSATAEHPLSVLPVRLQVPPTVRRHRFFIEAQACCMALRKGRNETNGGVIGTEDKGRAELYGWLNPVRTHIDDPVCKWTYGCVLSRQRLQKIGCIDPAKGHHYFAHAFAGQVYRIRDDYPHWTEGGGITIAICAGGFDEPDDFRALTILQRGIQRLANGVYTAPRVRPGFRFQLDDECLADRFDGRPVMVRRKTAERFNWLVPTCAEEDCGEPAHELDHHYPYFSDQNKCREHRFNNEARA